MSVLWLVPFFVNTLVAMGCYRAKHYAISALNVTAMLTSAGLYLKEILTK